MITLKSPLRIDVLPLSMQGDASITQNLNTFSDPIGFQSAKSPPSMLTRVLQPTGGAGSKDSRFLETETYKLQAWKLWSCRSVNMCCQIPSGALHLKKPEWLQPRHPCPSHHKPPKRRQRSDETHLQAWWGKPEPNQRPPHQWSDNVKQVQCRGPH